MVTSDYWEYYRLLDRELKSEFAFEVMQQTDWGKSTFYTRLKNCTGWKLHELSIVENIYSKFKRLYPYE